MVVKPIKISDEICKEVTKDGKILYRIKVVNKSFAMLTNLKYALYHCKMHGDGIITVSEIEQRKSPIVNMEKYSLKEDITDYAVRISYEIDPSVYPLNENCKLRFCFIADHALSNTSKSLRKEYFSNDIVEGFFQMGTSTKIIRKHN